MKFLIATLLMYSSVSMAAGSFCNSSVGKTMTLANYSPESDVDKKLAADYKDLSKSLQAKCIAEEKAGHAPDEIADYLAVECSAAMMKHKQTDLYPNLAKPCAAAVATSEYFKKMADDSFCNSFIGKTITLADYPTIYTDDSVQIKKIKDLSKDLQAKCVAEEKAGHAPEEISNYLSVECTSKIMANGMFPKLNMPCNIAASASQAYFDGIKKGKEEVKNCGDKTAVNDLSRTVKKIEHEITTPAKAKNNLQK